MEKRPWKVSMPEHDEKSQDFGGSVPYLFQFCSRGGNPVSVGNALSRHTIQPLTRTRVFLYPLSNRSDPVPCSGCRFLRRNRW